MFRRPPRSTPFPYPPLSRSVWQHNRQLQLVDAEGVALERVRPDAVPNLPLVIGPGAQHRVAALAALIEGAPQLREHLDRKSTRLNSSHANISYAVFCLKKKK